MGVLAIFKLSMLIVVLAIGWRWYQSYTRLPPVVGGHFLPQYRPVADLFRQYVADGTEQGASFAVYHRGERLVDLWGGYADPRSRRPWREDTVALAWSCTKGATALVIASLVNKGLLSYKDKVGQHWPEFAQSNGKENITVEMLLSHQAGLVTLGGKTITLLEYKNEWPKMEQLMLAAAPDFPPGSQVAYQAFTFGMYLDALIRRVDPLHRNLSQYFDMEIAKPYGIDFSIGLPLHQYYRAATLFKVSTWQLLSLVLDSNHHPLLWTVFTAPNSLLMRATKVLNVLNGNEDILNDPMQMEVGQGSFTGFGSARSLAKMYDLMVSGGSTGEKPLLPKSLVDMFSIPITRSLPREFGGSGLEFSQGFHLSKNAEGGVMFGHKGYGAQEANADPENQLGMAYITNFLWPNAVTPPDHYSEIERVFYKCFQKHQAKQSK